jgi:hypothetical protein
VRIASQSRDCPKVLRSNGFVPNFRARGSKNSVAAARHILSLDKIQSCASLATTKN